jgi:hypothetical protein
VRCNRTGRREARADLLGWTKGERSEERARRRGTEGTAGGRTNGSQGEQDEENGRPKTSRTARVPRRREKREGRRTTRDRDRTVAHGPVLLLAFGTMAEFVEISGDMCERALCSNRSRNRRQGQYRSWRTAFEPSTGQRHRGRLEERDDRRGSTRVGISCAGYRDRGRREEEDEMKDGSAARRIR